jgi:redox-sensitive bicupin YhaK (pirin superfamily)
VAGPGSTHSPMAFMHATLQPGARLRIPWNPTFNALAYVLAGSGRSGTEGRPVAAGQMSAFGPGDWITLQADDTQDSRSATFEVLLLGGRPIGEPVEHYGPFVMNTKAEIAQAMDDFEAGRLGRIPPNALMPHVYDPDEPRAEHTGI